MSPPERSALIAALGPAPELIDHILTFVESFSTLSSLLTTCRFLYQRFSARKDHILSSVLRNELGVVLTDAKFLSIFAYREIGIVPKWTLYWDSISAAATIYLKMLLPTSQSALVVQENLGLENPIKMCQDLRDFNYLADIYFKIQLSSFTQDGAPQPATAMSNSERLRVLRALYRRQIINNAWAATERKIIASWFDQDMAVLINPSKDEDGEDEDGPRPGLINTLKAWELQQIDHVDCFIKRLCASVWFATRRGFQRTVGAMSGEELCEILSRVDRLVPYMKKHPKVIEEAYSIFPAVSEHVNFSSAIIEEPGECISLVQRHSLPCFCTGWQRWRFRLHPESAVESGREASQEAPGTGNQQGPAKIEFTEDAVDSVPFAWADALNERAVHWYGEALFENAQEGYELRAGQGLSSVHNMRQRLKKVQLWRETGFALWDRERIKAIQALDRFSGMQTGWILF